MRLDYGVIRELHWHKEAEWAYVLEGNVRVTGLDTEGGNFIDDLQKGDLWYFPSGHPHSLQGLSENGTEFLLVFADGGFNGGGAFAVPPRAEDEIFKVVLVVGGDGEPDVGDGACALYVENGGGLAGFNGDRIAVAAAAIPTGGTARFIAAQLGGGEEAFGGVGRRFCRQGRRRAGCSHAQ